MAVTVTAAVVQWLVRIDVRASNPLTLVWVIMYAAMALYTQSALLRHAANSVVSSRATLVSCHVVLAWYGLVTQPWVMPFAVLAMVALAVTRILQALQKVLARYQTTMELSQNNRQLHIDLAVKTVQLEKEVEERRAAQKDLEIMNANLEAEIAIRTQDLASILDELSEVNTKLEVELDERKVLEAQLIQAQKLESVGQLAAGVAHEINNPIGFLMSNMSTLDEYVELILHFMRQYQTLEDAIASAGLEQHPSLEAELTSLNQRKKEEDLAFILSDMAHLMSESTEGLVRVKEIVQGLKSFSRIDESHVQEVDIHECIDSTLKVVWNELKYNCNIIKQYGAMPTIRCFPGQLNQVFMNLLVNAAHAMESRGDVVIRTEAVNLADEKSVLRITIQDGGKGIPPQLMNKIFDPFFTTKPVGKGSGLGLAISYGIVQKHNGTISVESVLGQGTTFTIDLPYDGVSDHESYSNSPLHAVA